MTVKSCSSCGHEDLEPGFIEDTGAHPGYGRWIPGKLETGLLGGAKLFGKERWDIHAYRCGNCGKLELYATEKTW
jgi:predicted nucleic-acid-binding Zn-ribbon protein